MWYSGWECWTKGPKDGMPSGAYIYDPCDSGQIPTYKPWFSPYCTIWNCEHENCLKMTGCPDSWWYKSRFLSTYFLIIFCWCSKNMYMELGVFLPPSVYQMSFKSWKCKVLSGVIGIVWHYFGLTMSDLKNWDTSDLSLLCSSSLLACTCYFREPWT